jgi:hypothetical protein
MNVLNRIAIIMLILALLAAVTALAAAPAEALGTAALVLGNLHGIAARLLPAGRALVALAGLGLGLLLLFWLWMEVRRPSYRTVRVRQSAGASAEVTTQTVRERVEVAVDALPGVVSAAARARSYGPAVEVWIDAEITPGTQVAPKADEIAATVREVTEMTLGLALRGKPHVRIRAVRLPAEAAVEPGTGPTPASPPPAAASGVLVVPAPPPESSPEPAREAETEPAIAEPSR